MSSIPIKQKPLGFTIVELMIVMVVIAILAAITIVAYTGVQNRAYDSAVQSDLRQYTNLVEIYAAQFGRYPTSDAHMRELVEEIGDVSVTANAYHPSGAYLGSGNQLPDNFLHCYSGTDTGATYVVVAASRSGNVYRNGSQGASSVDWEPGRHGPDSGQVCRAASDPELQGQGRFFNFQAGQWKNWVTQ